MTFSDDALETWQDVDCAWPDSTKFPALLQSLGGLKATLDDTKLNGKLAQINLACNSAVQLRVTVHTAGHAEAKAVARTLRSVDLATELSGLAGHACCNLATELRAQWTSGARPGRPGHGAETLPVAQ